MNNDQPLPALQELREALLDLSNQRSLESLTELAASRILGMREHFVRFAVWLVDAPDGNPTEPAVLRLAASAWKKGRKPRREWRHADGDFGCVPLTEPLIGVVAERGFQYAYDAEDWPGGLPEWAERAGIRAFGAKAMMHQDRLVGVLGLFSEFMIRDHIDDGRAFFGIFASHLAASIANAQAYEEIDRLRARLVDHNEYLQEELQVAGGLGGIVGRSEALRKCLNQVELVAPTDAAVQILGESGTGKELFAHAVHTHSPRRDGPMVKVNCAAVPRDLFESEFFGHVKGAFTGAVRERKGRFELADGGTLFLDEVGEIPLELQGKLLRVLQESEFERIGDEVSRRSDVRLVTATNKDLRREAEEGRFREDLYYRISVFPIELPPLRERREDIAELAQHFLKLAHRRLGGPLVRLQKRHLAELKSYDWPGNARELQNVIERAVITARTGKVRLDIPGASVTRPQEPSGDEDGPREILTEAEIRQLEVENLEAALEQTGGRVFGKQGAAQLLGIHPTTLSSRLRTLGLAPKKPAASGVVRKPASKGKARTGKAKNKARAKSKSKRPSAARRSRKS